MGFNLTIDFIGLVAIGRPKDPKSQDPGKAVLVNSRVLPTAHEPKLSVFLEDMDNWTGFGPPVAVPGGGSLITRGITGEILSIVPDGPGSKGHPKCKSNPNIGSPMDPSKASPSDCDDFYWVFDVPRFSGGTETLVPRAYLSPIDPNLSFSVVDLVAGELSTASFVVGDNGYVMFSGKGKQQALAESIRYTLPVNGNHVSISSRTFAGDARPVHTLKPGRPGSDVAIVISNLPPAAQTNKDPLVDWPAYQTVLDGNPGCPISVLRVETVTRPTCPGIAAYL